MPTFNRFYIWALVFLSAVQTAAQENTSRTGKTIFFAEDAPNPKNALCLTDMGKFIDVLQQNPAIKMNTDPKKSARTIDPFSTTPQPLAVNIKNIQASTLDDLNSIMRTVPMGAYYRDLRLVELSQFSFVPDQPNFDNNQIKINRRLDVLNKETPFWFAHEFSHFADHQEDIRGLSLDDLLMFELHSEIAARVNAVLARRLVLIETGRLDLAFPKNCLDFKQGRLAGKTIAMLLEKPFFWQDAAAGKLANAVCKKFGEYAPWLSWLFSQNLLPDACHLSPGEADKIMISALDGFDGEYGDLYKASILKLVEYDVHFAFVQRNRIPEQTPSPTFRAVLEKIYTYTLGWERICLMDSLSEKTHRILNEKLARYKLDYKKALNRMAKNNLLLTVEIDRGR